MSNNKSSPPKKIRSNWSIEQLHVTNFRVIEIVIRCVPSIFDVSYSFLYPLTTRDVSIVLIILFMLTKFSLSSMIRFDSKLLVFSLIELLFRTYLFVIHLSIISSLYSLNSVYPFVRIIFVVLCSKSNSFHHIYPYICV